MTKAFPRCLAAGVITTVALVLLLGQSVQADSPKPARTKTQTYMVLVGISQYGDKQIKPRPNAEADVKALYDVAINKDYIAADPANVKLLLGTPTGKAEQATRANLLKAVKWLSEEVQPGDNAFLVFVGQGGPLGESGDRRCYFLSDSTFKNRNKDAVAAEEIEDSLKKFKGNRLCVLLDVDFKGFTDEATGRAIAEPTLGKAPYREFLGDDNSEDHLPLAGRVAFLATNGLHASLDLKDHGVFTKVMLEGLQGKADTEGYEGDGLVTVDELARYMNKRLPDLCRDNGKTEKEKEQDPYVLAGPTTHFILSQNPTAAATARKRQTQFAKLVEAGKLTGELAEEGKVLLERMPVLKKKQELRKAYQQLVDARIDLEKFKEKRDEILASMQLKLREATLFAQKVIDATDVIKDEYVRDVNQGQMIGWAIKELYTFVEEKIPEKIEEKLKDVKSMRPDRLRELLVDARVALGKREDLDNQKDLNITLQRMLHRLDPHTTYIDPEMRKKFEADIAGNFTGIGIQIRKDSASDQLLVVTPIKGSPAHRAGLQAGDLITRIIRDVDSEGEAITPTQVVETKGMGLDKAVKLILGQPNTKVKLQVQREGRDKPFEVEITRSRIEVESVLGAQRKNDDDWDFMIDHRNKIGYVRLSSFARNTYRDLESVMAELKRQGVKGMVLDLRFNPGGLLDIAIKVTDLYIDDGLIVSVRPRGGVARESRFNGRHTGSMLDFPMVCLVNGYSASGSEIVSAALQDHSRAVVIGERSYGKGSVQNIKDFDVMDPKTGENLKAEIKLTTASFWRPNGKNLNKASTEGKEEDVWGVIPDKVIKLNSKERRELAEHQRNLETIEPEGKKDRKKEFKDRQLDAALEYLRGQIKTASRAPVLGRSS